MGTINKRTRKDGSIGYTAQVVRKRNGKTVFSRAETFDRRGAAEAWMRRLEAQLDEPGGLERLTRAGNDVPLRDVIRHYRQTSAKPLGRTKRQVLDAIEATALAGKRCSEIGSDDIADLARELHEGGREPATVSNYLAHLAPIFQIARPAWKFPLDPQAMVDGRIVAKRLGHVGKSKSRARRPTLDELDLLLAHFTRQSRRYPGMIPMHKLIGYAIFSCRRQEEICTITHADMDAEGMRQLVRDMKDPARKDGNHVLCDLTPEALAIAQSMPESEDGRIFPYNHKTVSALFTRACYTLGINTEDMPDQARLHFHDLRHEGVSRLFEMGWTIPRVAGVSGHRSWQTLKRYSHVRQIGDKFAGWKWLPILTAKGWTPVVVAAGG